MDINSIMKQFGVHPKIGSGGVAKKHSSTSKTGNTLLTKQSSIT
jgi:hypothetical protein